MAKIVGFEAKTFTFEDGNKVNGYYLHTEDHVNGVTGVAVDRAFLSDKKLNGYVPVIGDEIIINYNRFGKPQAIIRM